MERIYVRGGVPLRGTIRVGGSKNAGLGLMAACLLVDGRTTLRGMPDIRDIHVMAEVLRALGAEVRFSPGEDMVIDASGFRRTTAPDELMVRMRASFYVLGPMLARLGEARIAQPGGCRIGARPVDFHLRGLERLGARCRVTEGIVQAYAEGLKGAHILLDFPSAGATTHLMMAAALAEGQTLIENAAAEPEVADVAHLLTHLGARVDGAGSSRVRVQGVEALKRDQVYTVIPDRMEAGTYACAAAMTRGDLRIENVVPAHMHPVMAKLREMGVALEVPEDEDVPGTLGVRMDRRPRATDVIAMPHPGFPTDMQQPVAALLSLADGTSSVTDQVFENRFRYVEELRRMGAQVEVQGRTAIFTGVDHLHGAALDAPDLRAGAALIVAALGAEGESAIAGVEHVDRGYDNLVKKLVRAGADISRVDVETVKNLAATL